MSKEKQIDDMTLAALSCYRNKYYADGNSTEQGIIANAINDVLPALVSLRKENCRKQSEGEWKDRYNGKYANQLYACSICEKKAPRDIKVNELGHEYLTQILSPFCPNCGAKMKGANSEN